ncbi:VOC family protein [Brachybacterium sp. Z12]|uniref:VOC family protein n=1 Tax=Brachybacterium sp. Z12 TaxID=2759167 RepID=UPI001862963F|nr:VOC family protein [Brachybacterium sp. Z12]QNN83587.1 VOC family protein [Brachybacterium sp. Z12]
MRLHHMQVSMPRGEEGEARRFYAGALELQEVPKPHSLAGRGGCWFRAYDGDTVTAEIHLGVEDPFRPAAKAHPGLVCDTLEELEATAQRIENGGYELSWEERDTFEGYLRFHARDGFGNRVEVMTLDADPSR